MAYKRISQLVEVAEADSTSFIPIDKSSSAASNKITVENLFSAYPEDAPSTGDFANNYYVRHNKEWVAVDLSNIQGFALDNVKQYNDVAAMEAAGETSVNRLYIIKNDRLAYYYDADTATYTSIAVDVSESIENYGINKNTSTLKLYLTNDQDGTNYQNQYDNNLKIATGYSVGEQINTALTTGNNDIKTLKVSFTEAPVRANIATGETLGTSLGKISKIYTDLNAGVGFKVTGTGANNVAAGDHSHTSAKITALTGYEVAASYVAVSAADSLNTAVGKLSKGIEDLVDGTTPAQAALSATYSNNGYTTCVHSKNGTVHNIANTGNKQFIAFKSTAIFNSGDTFTVNGTAITTLKTQRGDSLSQKFFDTGYWVTCIYDSTANSLVFASGGGSAWYAGSSAPTDVSLIWFDSGNSYIGKIYIGDAWVPIGAVWK